MKKSICYSNLINALRQAEDQKISQPMKTDFAARKLGKGALYVFENFFLRYAQGEEIYSDELDMEAFSLRELREMISYFDRYHESMIKLKRMIEKLITHQPFRSYLTFYGFDMEIRPALDVLQFAKLAYDYYGTVGRYQIHQDTGFEIFEDLFNGLCDYVSCSDGECVETYQFHVDEFQKQYFALCEVYGLIKGIPWDTNPYVQYAKTCAEYELYRAVNPYLDYRVDFSLKEPVIELMVYEYIITQSGELLEALFRIASFYKKGLKHLQAAVKEELQYVY